MILKDEICTLVPAAGRGSRLGGDYPKVFTPIIKDCTIWDIIHSKLLKIANNHCLVLNSFVYEQYKDKISKNLNIAFQDNPIGMGDAIFQGYKFWKNSKYLIIVWGDQVNISDDTLKQVVSKFTKDENDQLILPLVKQESPYVEYIFKDEILVNILQQREGDITSKGGLSDIGVFGLTTNNLDNYWAEYLSENILGNATGEINFLPFLSFLSFKKNWSLKKILIQNVDESRGINTPNDLEYFRKLYLKGDIL